MKRIYCKSIFISFIFAATVGHVGFIRWHPPVATRRLMWRSRGVEAVARVPKSPPSGDAGDPVVFRLIH